MPARTLPASPDPALSPPRFHPRQSPHIPSSSAFRRDSHDDRLPQDDPRYAQAMPAQLVRLDPAAQSAAPDQHVSPSGWSPASNRVYPDPASIPPHWQIHPASLAPFRDGRTQVAPGTAIQSSVHLPWTRPYPLSGYPRIVPVQPFAAPPPPPIPHKVWILDCKSCGTFLTNRGMKVSLVFVPTAPPSVMRPPLLPPPARTYTYTSSSRRSQPAQGDIVRRSIIPARGENHRNTIRE
ncbi:hypothetical protein C8Q78DRAFT_1008761 [Trametes maxima]|nr:hypothetical protein C8Q78DRAFT_1008761 [Trametes maxima]